MIFTGFRILHVDTQPVASGSVASTRSASTSFASFSPSVEMPLRPPVRIAHRRELAVRQLLLRHHTHTCKRSPATLAPGCCRAVQRCVYNADILLGRINGILMDHLAFSALRYTDHRYRCRSLVQTGRLCRSLVHGFHLVIIRHRARTSAIMPVSWGGVICAPSSQYTL